MASPMADQTLRTLTGFLQLADQSDAASGPAGHTWTRDDLHARSATPTSPGQERDREMVGRGDDRGVPKGQRLGRSGH